ncbi:transposable element Tc3 transposase [Trichonephila clavipes]|nr:transposable element Tc3 transposase [Trichonephila clavipes]
MATGFNSCQVIYSQFGLSIHQNDHQARRRFVEWAQNEIAVVPDFHKRILFSDETYFWLNGYVNKTKLSHLSEANPQVYVETPLHPERLTVWCALWAGGILLQNDEGHNVTVNGDRYRAMITNFFIPELNNHDVQELWFQQDGATCHTARATIDLLKDTFGDRLISRFGPVNWPIRSCDLTSQDYFLWGYVKSLVYADKPQTLDRFLSFEHHAGDSTNLLGSTPILRKNIPELFRGLPSLSLPPILRKDLQLDGFLEYPYAANTLYIYKHPCRLLDSNPCPMTPQPASLTFIPDGQLTYLLICLYYEKCDACKRQIYRSISKRNRRTTAQQVANQFLATSGKQISRKTVARRLRGGGLYACRPVECVPLTRQHRTARLQWCREHHNSTEQDWACVLFSDESRFSLSSDCRSQLIWRESGTAYRPENIQEKDRYPTCSIMVWAGIMINGRTRLHVVVNGTMTGQRYIDEVLLPHVRLFVVL